MTNIFLFHGEIAHELTQVIGVFDNLEDALQRCRDRPFAAKDEQGLESMPYDVHWVEEWELGGNFVRQHNLAGFEIQVEAHGG